MPEVEREMSDDEKYFAVDAMNASTVKAGATSMLYMNHIISNPIKATPAMILGTQRHCALLEPDRFEKLTRFDCSRRTKQYKAIAEEQGERNIISEKEYVDCIKAAEIARNHPAVVEMKLLEGGVAEKEFYWEEENGKAKAKLDYYVEDHFFVEYKTTQKLAGFIHTAARLHYDLGLGWYSRACGGLPGVFIVQESSAPYDVAVYEVQQYNMERWWTKCKAIWDKYLTGDRSGAYDTPIMFELPSYADDDVLIELEG